jgi:deoxyribodipyrimidine photo-lyase
MSDSPVDPDRIRDLNEAPVRGDAAYVLYWMQQSQRAGDNPALEHAACLANALGKPLGVVFGVMARYPGANARHYRFMAEGLAETARALERRGVSFAVYPGPPPRAALKAARNAALLVCDRGYLGHQEAWRLEVAKKAPCRVIRVEGDAVVPVERASEKAEYQARTLRPKIHRLLDRFLEPIRTVALGRKDPRLLPGGLELDSPERLLERIAPPGGAAPVPRLFRGGALEAKKRFARFLRAHLPGYAENRRRPEVPAVSHMGMYLHFGQLSPVALALEIRKSRKEYPADADAFLEEMIVRRELAANFVRYTPAYDTFECIAGWARKTLEAHRGERKKKGVTLRALENAETPDPYWNAAMKEMQATGYLHNYMRMYWGKRILEWIPDPAEAHSRLLEWNNRFFLDGRDPNSFAAAAWVFGVHDRPWPERPGFGTVRSISAGGLERKCDIRAWVRDVETRAERAGS